MPSAQTIESFIQLVESGQTVEAMERHCAEHASMRENADAARTGKQACCIRPVILNGGHVVRQSGSGARNGAAMTSPVIRAIRLDDAKSFRQCLDSIARERCYLAQLEVARLLPRFVCGCGGCGGFSVLVPAVAHSPRAMGRLCKALAALDEAWRNR